MKKISAHSVIAIALLATLALTIGKSKASPRLDPSPSPEITSDCKFKGFKLYGKIKVVESFPDLKVQVVESFPDLKVKIVENFPTSCGKWQYVESFPDLKIQFVTSFPDIKVKFVNAFEGKP